MKLQVEERAVNWYKEELELEENDYLRFFVRYGGVGGIVPGFSLGVSPSKPVDPIAEVTENGITFYVEQKDEWYFDNTDLVVNFDEALDEPIFDYKTE
ncbi:uncharacterized protein YneR [Salirhabdus euzebyi]|uniref:Uncharacterized protein YneR n=1 Tax=Salirhabdus euzebyi TaxID=394506 RepID=A0A841Q2G2_9BACI|nr:HesB/YadR/YfhF family protein [Salirhabdus euzebyi]MBB6452802.1 uncharacterized protein YneR [Salirhabdus euzebyi]